MQTQMQCPLGGRSKCKIDASLELSGGRGIVQANCLTCGHGQGITLPLAEALELHDELHRHVLPVEPEKNQEPKNQEPNEQAAGGETEPGAASGVPPVQAPTALTATTPPAAKTEDPHPNPLPEGEGMMARQL